MKAVLGESDGAVACRAYGVADRGNSEHGTTVLYRAVELEALEEARLESLRDQLFRARTTRIRPGRDENILTSWNALMIQGLCAAYQATGTPAQLAAAKHAADFIEEKLSTPTGGVYRAWKDGTAKVPGFLDDHAFLANALIDLYESCFEKRYLDRASRLVYLILEKFWEDDLYFTPGDGEKLVHRPRAPLDNAWPSGTSASTFALLRLYELTGRDLYRHRGEHVFRMYGGAAAKNPYGVAHLLSAMDFIQRGPLEIVLAGDKLGATALVEGVHRAYIPSRVLAFSEHVPIGEGRHPVDGQPAPYVCRNRTCGAPVTTAKALIDSGAE